MRTYQQTQPTLNIDTYLDTLKLEGYAKATIKTHKSKLTRVAKTTNLENPLCTMQYIADSQQTNSSKHTLVEIINNYYKHKNIKWTPPKYKPNEHIPYIPTDEELKILIISSGKTLGTALLLLKETGARIGEITQIEWNDINENNHTVTINHPEKNSNPRTITISDRLLNSLKALPKTNKTIFTSNESLRHNYERTRKIVIKKTQNPRYKQIHFHTFRHYKGTMEYHKTKDIVHVKYILGHKSITSTMIYINLERALWLSKTDEWRHAKPPKPSKKQPTS